VKKGPGRKAKKQGEPEIPSRLIGELTLNKVYCIVLLVLQCNERLRLTCRNVRCFVFYHCVFFGPGADGDIKLPSQEIETRSQSGKLTGYRLNWQR